MYKMYKIYIFKYIIYIYIYMYVYVYIYMYIYIYNQIKVLNLYLLRSYIIN